MLLRAGGRRRSHARRLGAALKTATGAGVESRLAPIQNCRGISHETLGEAVGVSPRVIAYYEADDAQPPGPMLADLARALRVTTDELLGLAPVREDLATPRTARLLARLRRAADLPAHDQRAVITFVEALLDKRGLDYAT